MELGNLIFGHSRGAVPVTDRHAYYAAIKPLFVALGCDGYGTSFDNGVFYMRPYCWCDKDSCPQCGESGDAVNFYHKASGVGLMWYKYAMRDAYLSEDIGLDRFRELVSECVQSIQPREQRPSPDKAVSVAELEKTWAKITANSTYRPAVSSYSMLFDPLALQLASLERAAPLLLLEYRPTQSNEDSK